MKNNLLLALLAIFSLGAIAEEEIDITLVKNFPSGSGGTNNGRSSLVHPTASVDSFVSSLSIAYPLDAVSVVQIVDEATDAVVYSGSFGATRLVVIDLEEEGIPAGNYCLRIFVFGEWWRGYFEINE